MTETRRTWRGKWVAPRTPGEAWRRFARNMLGILAVLAGILVIVLLTMPGGATLQPKGERDFLLIIIASIWVVPLAIVLQVWTLMDRLAAFRRGEIHVEDDEIAPGDVPPPSRRKRRETPAQARRRRKFWIETGLFTAVWLFCTGLIGWVSFEYWMAGKPLGNMGAILLGLLIIYPVIIVIMVQDKQDKDRGL